MAQHVDIKDLESVGGGKSLASSSDNGGQNGMVPVVGAINY